MSESGRAHRPGLFKLPQKKHSTGRHRSKRSIARENKGRLSIRNQVHHKPRDLKKLDRRKRLSLISANKNAKLLEQKRHEGGAPIMITILSFDDNYKSLEVAENLCSADSDVILRKNGEKQVLHLAIPRLKSRYSFLCPNANCLIDTLDCLRVSDILLLFWPLNTDKLERNHEKLLTMVQAQGMPSTLNIVSGLPPCGRKRDSMKKTLEKIMANWTKDFRVHNLDNSNDYLQLLRQIFTMKKLHSNLQKMRPYLFAEKIQVIKEGQSSKCSIRVYGCLRGAPLNINNLVHIPGFGDFQLSQIDCNPDPFPLKENMNEMASIHVMKSDPLKQTPLDSETVPNQLNEDQPRVDEDIFKVPTLKRRVPKGTSEYQASWLIYDEDDEDSEEENDTDGEKNIEETYAELESNESRMEENEANSDNNNQNDEEMQSEMLSISGMDTNEIDAAEKDAMDESQLEYFRQERENSQWPDEVEAPNGMSARERFQRYRGLKSFRTSPWDSKENLPHDYMRIYKIVDFKRTRKLALAEVNEAFETVNSDEYVFPGTFVTLYVDNVPAHLCESLHTESTLLVFGLLRHEHRMSTLNLILQKHPSCTVPIKNKDQLVFQVGCRRFISNPVFSQHTNGNKFKMERFMPTSGAFCATTFAPITFSPTNVVVYRQMDGNALQLVASGIVLDTNPDRIILKRAVLSGHPFKVNKRSAIVRYMFFNKEDIEWFKPVELYTQSGRHGRIKQSLGTHGLMKCVFDQPMNVQDAVLLNLYKRVFPKWTYNAEVRIEQPFCIDSEDRSAEINDDKGQKTVQFNLDELMDQ